MDHAEIAAFGAPVADAADAGDDVARAILADAGRELARRALAVIENTGLEGGFDVGLVGSNWKAGRAMIGPFAEMIGERAPQARVAPAELEAVGGSLLLAATPVGAWSWTPTRCRRRSPRRSRVASAPKTLPAPR